MKFLRTPLLQNTSVRLLLIRYNWKRMFLWFYFCYFTIGFLWSFIYIQNFFDVVRKKLPLLFKRRLKVQDKNLSVNVLYLNSDQWKTFLKSIGQWDLGYGLFTNLPRIIVACDFSRVHSNSKELSYLSWQNTYPNLKTACHIKLKFFFWTKLLENLLLAKYLISVAGPLTYGNRTEQEKR